MAFFLRYSAEVIDLYIMMSLLMLSSVMSTCKFPAFINNEDVWVQTNSEGAQLTAYIKPHIIEAKYCSYEGSACERYVRNCIEHIDENKYIVKHEISSQGFAPSYYMCMEFINRSNTIIQIRTSKTSEIPSASLCDELVLNNWPLFSTSLKTATPIQCPFSGGYNMRIRHNNRELCSDKMLSPRLESECETGEGMTFDFKHPECMHQNLKMKLIHRVDCMATWEDRGYHFVILRPESSHFQALCLRVKEPLDNIKHVYLFMDLVCDPGNTHGQPKETDNYLSIEFERKLIHSVCADEFEGCSDERFCDTGMREHCKLSCRTCQSDVKICAFPEYLCKVWSLFDGKKPVRYVNITTYEIGFPDVGRFQCLYHNVTDKHRSVLLHIFDNGCYPKFTCMETYYISDTVRQFRLGKRINWPMFPLSRVLTHACKPTMFKEEYQVGENIEYLKIPKLTVVDAGYTKSVNCKLSYEFRNHLNGLYFHEDTKCDGCVYHDETIDPQRFEVRTIQCPQSAPTIEYICLASLKIDNETTAIITGTQSRRHLQKITEFLCWMFTGSGDKRKIVIFDSADCNEVKLKLALAGDIVPKSMFDVIEDSPKFCPSPIINDAPEDYQPQPEIPVYATESTIKNASTRKDILVSQKPNPAKPAERIIYESGDTSSATSMSLNGNVVLLFSFVMLRWLHIYSAKHNLD